ncbi:MAG: nitrogenase molybdenum-iron protein [Lentisphaeria bacterium]|nr:nitrogenase molybdenum-iron protein [Lentisphaeria bacterium]
MKKLLKLLSPFAPDHSGAVSALFELGGLLVVCDAGGCTGNICGFDEPRYFHAKCALFSAGLRDMDAILGQDERLAGKVAQALEETGMPFAVLIGTPVPAVIATDFSALRKMVEKRASGKRCLAVETKGTALYDEGVSLAFLQLVKTFALERREVTKGRIGVWGATPLDLSFPDASRLVSALVSSGKCGKKEEVFCYGMGAKIPEIEQASRCEKNLVIAPGGLAAAKELFRKFGTPYEVAYPCLPASLKRKMAEWKNRSAGRKEKVLIVHEQFAANAAREELEKDGSPDWEIHTGTFFRFFPEYGRNGDLVFAGEEDFAEKLEKGNYTLLIADEVFHRFLKEDSPAGFIPFTHFAVSGRLEEE